MAMSDEDQHEVGDERDVSDEILKYLKRRRAQLGGEHAFVSEASLFVPLRTFLILLYPILTNPQVLHLGPWPVR